MDHHIQLARLLLDDAKKLLLFLLRLIQLLKDHIGISLHIGNGRPQLVGDIGEELLAGIPDMLQIPGQIIDGLSQSSDFIPGAYGQPVLQIASGNGPRCFLHPHQRPGHNLGNSVAEGDSKRKSNGGGGSDQNPDLSQRLIHRPHG
ncbi:hypothetical protein D3C75_942660 [compost metagenome]